MIKANELRIGNWLLGCNNYYFQVDTDTFVALEHKSSNYNSDCPAPIPLTPEILEKCGFVRKENTGSGITWDYGKFRLIQGYLPEFYLDAPHYGKAYTTLHQLQNLYFALTQTELQITL